MAEFLLEILSEEIPARMQARAAEDIKRLVGDSLKKDGLKFENLQTFATPRRLTLVIKGLPLETEAVEDVRRGPPKAAPEAAVAGFAKSNGVSVHQLEIRDTGKGEYYFAVIKENARQTIEYLPLVVSEIIFNLSWPKSMRWNSTEATWVRPIQGILAIFNGQPLTETLQLGVKNRKIPGLKFAMGNGSNAIPGELEIPFSDTTYGHRFLAPGPIKGIKNFADYRERLREAYVMLDAEERRETLLEDADRLAQAEGFRLRNDPGLFAEVAGLIEWPVALIGRIDDAFMDVPAEVLTESMRAHQKYFALESRDRKLAPHFITIANMLTDDGGAAIVAGNERVLRARLSDARFFWDQDRKAHLESRVAKLGPITFHAKLGTVLEKVERMESLAAVLCDFIPGADRNKATRAAHLAKADLTSGMVGEFPELQGIMGRYYALADGEDADVAEAIAEHYSPKGPNDSCPTAPIAIAVALADKIDSLAGFFAVGEKPTGSRDPFALRRAALGVIRIVTENRLRLPLARVFKMADTNGKLDVAEMLAFFADRLKVQMREKGVRHDLIEAVFATPQQDGGGEDDLVRLLTRVDALTALLGTEDGANLLTAYRRAANIVAIEEKKDRTAYDGAVDEKLLAEPQEQRLNDVLALEEQALDLTLKAEKYGDAMAALAHLREPVDAFFDRVTVNADDKALRANRLRLLSRIRGALNRVADFSKIEG